VCSIAAAADGTLYLGTANRGTVYQYSSGVLKPLYSTAYGSVDGVCLLNGKVVAGSGKALYETDSAAPGPVRQIDLRTGPVMSLHAVGAEVFAGTGDGRLYVIRDDVPRLVEDSQAGPTVGLAADASGRLLALHASPAEIHLVPLHPAPGGWYQTPVLDANDSAQWGATRWHQDSTGGETVQILTRSGNTSEPDPSWTSWTPLVQVHEGEHSSASEGRIASPPARYLQLRTVLASSNGKAPSLSDMTIYYRPAGRLPRVAFTAPVAGDAWSGKHKVAWKIDQGVREDLSYDVEASNDGGKTWRTVDLGHRAALKERALANDDHAAVDDSVEWDTKQVPDGTWLIRVAVRDLGLPRASSVSFLAPLVTVVNHTPDIDFKTTTLQPERLHVEGTARAHLVPVLEVSYRIEGGDWHAAQSDNGFFDSPTEAFTIDEPVAKKPGWIEVRVADEAGNSQTVRKTF
jgi:hypothetical protein